MGIPETFLKTQQVASALGVSASTIKRWVDAGAIEATRTMGKHRMILLSSALKFARQSHFSVDSLLALRDDLPLSSVGEATVEALTELLKAGRIREASALIVLAFRSNLGASILADQLIRPVMDRVGHGWMVGSWDVYQEHEATLAVASALSSQLAGMSREADSRRPLALGATSEGDTYVLPGLLGELVLREIGWNVKNLGTNLPLRSLALATRDYRPKLVFLSVSHLVDRPRFLMDYPYFYEAATQVGAAIILGGRAVDADLRSKLVYASFGERMAHLAEFGRQLLPATGTIPGAVTDHHPESMDISI